jgi:hypothetical protein|tara:strand:- start:103 stop:282 length:180 start_codon:yes stop_codon:yes gene_type:complete
MGDKIKKFRERYEDDEWGSDDDNRGKSKEKKKRQRDESRKHKFSDRWFDEDMNIKRKKD